MSHPLISDILKKLDEIEANLSFERKTYTLQEFINMFGFQKKPHVQNTWYKEYRRGGFDRCIEIFLVGKEIELFIGESTRGQTIYDFIPLIKTKNVNDLFRLIHLLNTTQIQIPIDNE